MTERTPCPFCGGRDASPERGRGRIRIENTVIGEWFMYCLNCGARGPVAYQHHRSDETCMYEAITLLDNRTREEQA